MILEFSDAITNGKTGQPDGVAASPTSRRPPSQTSSPTMSCWTPPLLPSRSGASSESHTVLATASSIYESLEFTAEAHERLDDVSAMASNGLRWHADQGHHNPGTRRPRQGRRSRHPPPAAGCRAAVLGRDTRSPRRRDPGRTISSRRHRDVTACSTNSLSQNRSRNRVVARCPTAPPECGRPSPRR